MADTPTAARPYLWPGRGKAHPDTSLASGAVECNLDHICIVRIRKLSPIMFWKGVRRSLSTDFPNFCICKNVHFLPFPSPPTFFGLSPFSICGFQLNCKPNEARWVMKKFGVWWFSLMVWPWGLSLVSGICNTKVPIDSQVSVRPSMEEQSRRGTLK